MKTILMDDIDTKTSEAHIRIDMDATDEARHHIEEVFIKFSDAVKEILTSGADHNTR